jgi:hypothetical protein
MTLYTYDNVTHCQPLRESEPLFHLGHLPIIFSSNTSTLYLAIVIAHVKIMVNTWLFGLGHKQGV